MKKPFLILFIFLAAGCVASKNSQSVFEDTGILGCPDLIKQAAKNLEDLGVNKEKVQIWMESALSRELHPCNSCDKLNEAAVVLKDEQGSYKAAMKKLIRAVETIDPNSKTPKEKQIKKIGDDLVSNDDDMDSTTLAGKYIDALEVLEAFLIGEMNFPFEEAKNFILDDFFIPLMALEKEAPGDL